MSITPIAPTAGTAGAGTINEPSSTAPSQSMLDREAFLKLLVAQLRYQDPSKPIDSSEMIAQSAQLTVVDKLGEIASSLERSASAERLSLAGSIVGKRISFAGSDGYPVEGIVDYVRFDNGAIILGAGGYDVPYEAVMAVADAPTTGTTPDPQPSSPTATSDAADATEPTSPSGEPAGEPTDPQETDS